MPSIAIHHGATTALEKLSPSRLVDAQQMQLLGGDVDIDAFHLQLREGIGLQVVSAITDATIDRTVDGASTLTVSLVDDDARSILRSGVLVKGCDVNIDGLWFTLVGVTKNGLALDLKFEEREVNLLRRYNTPLFADRSKITRAQFVLRMIREVKEVRLSWCIPELNIKQPVSDIQPGTVLINGNDQPVANTRQVQDALTSQQMRGKGISPNASLTVKGVRATREQIKNANIILAQCDAQHAPRKVAICSIMTAITESTIHNYTNAQSDGASVGVFQQIKSAGWPATRNVATDAAAFIIQCMRFNILYPNLSYGMLCQEVQHSAISNGSNYAPWQDEATKFVDAYDRKLTPAEQQVINVSSTIGTNTNMYVRGQISKAKGMSSFLLTPENSWNCMQRLASEVNWRAFVVSGVVYFVSEQWLIKAKPFMTISEDTPGIDWIDFDFDEGKFKGTLTVTAHFGRWSAPPGSTVEVEKMGPINGKYIVNDVTRSLYSEIGTITLEKPMPELPEPVTLGGIPSGFSLTPKAGGTPKVDPGISDIQGNAMQKAVVAFAKSQLGVKYVYGAESPGHAFDCSGLTQAAYSAAGLKPKLPRVAQDQYNYGRKMSLVEKLEPGDLVFFGSSVRNIGHVGIYIGGGKMIDAPHTGANVRIEDYDWTGAEHFVGATRPWQK